MANLNEQRPSGDYGSEQQQLYAVCEIGWNSFTLFQPNFELFSTKYADPFGANQKAAVLAASQPQTSETSGIRYLYCQKHRGVLQIGPTAEFVLH